MIRAEYKQINNVLQLFVSLSAVSAYVVVSNRKLNRLHRVRLLSRRPQVKERRRRALGGVGCVPFVSRFVPKS